MDSGDLAALVLSDLFAAFDTVDHAILFRRLETFWARWNCSTLFRVLPGRPRAACSYSSYTSSSPSVIECGVPQRSVLGPIVFLLHVAALQLLIENCRLRPHHFSDDTQIYGFCSPTPSSCTELLRRIYECVDVSSSWMRSHRLQFNTDKMEIIWLTTGRRSHLLPQPLRFGSDLITPVLVVRYLGIHIDADVSTRSHVMKTTSACFAVLHQLRDIRRSVPRTVFQSLVLCLVLPRLDYCNAVLPGIPLHLARRLQSVMNEAAQLVFAS